MPSLRLASVAALDAELGLKLWGPSEESVWAVPFKGLQGGSGSPAVGQLNVSVLSVGLQSEPDASTVTYIHLLV